MKLQDYVPRRIRFAIAVILLNLLLYWAFRVVFLAMFASQSSPLDGGLLVRAFYIGLKFDLRLAVLVVLPMLLLSWLPGLNLVRSRLGRGLWLGYLIAAAVAAVWLFMVDLGHYDYLQTRLNATVLEHLEAPDISVEMLWQSYPVVWVTLGVILLAVGYGWLLRRLARWTMDGTGRAVGWLRKGLVSALFAGVLLLGLYGKLSYYPLRWSEAYFTPHPLASALALNPILYFFDTLNSPQQQFNEEEVRKYYGAVAAYLGVRDPDPERLRFARQGTPIAGLPGSPNVVMISLESFSAFKVGIMGNPLDSTPNFDALAREGWLFSNFFVPSTGTARSIFTALFGIPDVSQSTTSSRNPLVVDQHTIINSFQGYDKLYFIGGSASWGNIRGILAYNVPDLKLYEEGYFKSPRIDVWGISDLHLFEETNAVLRTHTGGPFFAFIQTAGNHRPYTIPEDSGGYQWADPGTDDLKQKGFISAKEFNAFRYLDFSLGHYMRLARKEAYFNNTVFIIFGDHGVPGYADHLPPGFGKHQLTQHQVPLLIYAPGFIKRGRVIKEVASELDVMPTIAGLVGKPYLNTTLGRDVLQPGLDGRRGAFIMIPYQNPPPIGIVDEEFYFVIGTDGQEKLYRYRSAEPERDVTDAYPERARGMAHLTRGLYETARYMLFNNHRRRETR